MCSYKTVLLLCFKSVFFVSGFYHVFCKTISLRIKMSVTAKIDPRLIKPLPFFQQQNELNFTLSLLVILKCFFKCVLLLALFAFTASLGEDNSCQGDLNEQILRQDTRLASQENVFVNNLNKGLNSRGH